MGEYKSDGERIYVLWDSARFRPEAALSSPGTNAAVACDKMPYSRLGLSPNGNSPALGFQSTRRGASRGAAEVQRALESTFFPRQRRSVCCAMP